MPTKPSTTTTFLFIAIAAVALPSLAAAESAKDETTGIAQRFAANTDAGGMSKQIGAIADCYKAATRHSAESALRRCLIMDLAAYEIDVARTKLFPGSGPALQYFEPSAYAARLAHYTPLAKFRDVPEAMAYLKPRSEAVLGEFNRIKKASH